MSGPSLEKRDSLREKAIALQAVTGVGHDRECAFRALHIELTEEVVLSLLDAIESKERELALMRPLVSVVELFRDSEIGSHMLDQHVDIYRKAKP